MIRIIHLVHRCLVAANIARFICLVLLPGWTVGFSGVFVITAFAFAFAFATTTTALTAVISLFPTRKRYSSMVAFDKNAEREKALPLRLAFSFISCTQLVATPNAVDSHSLSPEVFICSMYIYIYMYASYIIYYVKMYQVYAYTRFPSACGAS